MYGIIQKLGGLLTAGNGITGGQRWVGGGDDALEPWEADCFKKLQQELEAEERNSNPFLLSTEELEEERRRERKRNEKKLTGK